jgi:hypothetical protein
MAKNDSANATQVAAVATAETTAAVAMAVPASTPTHHLIVIHPFGSYNKGERIEDANEIAAVLAGENAGSCNRIPVST